MDPLDRIDPGVLRDLVGIAFDVDDTLTRGGRLERDAIEALYDLSSAGLRLVAVTGRPIGWVEPLVKLLPIDAAVGENGAGVVYLRGASVTTDYADDEGTRVAHATILARVRERVRARMPAIRETNDGPARRCDLAFDIGESERVSEVDIAALVSLIEGAGARAVVSSVHAHAVPGDWDKARGVARAVERALGSPLDPGAWLFIGDSGNDAAAFAFFPHTVGVANVREHLSQLPVPPRFVTSSDRGRGFAELARHVLMARAS